MKKQYIYPKISNREEVYEDAINENMAEQNAEGGGENEF